MPLSQTTSLCHIQSVSVTDSMCLSQTVSVCHRQYVPSQTVCVCHRQSVSVTDSLCLSQTVCVCNRIYVSVTDGLFLSQTVFVCHRHRQFIFSRPKQTQGLLYKHRCDSLIHWRIKKMLCWFKRYADFVVLGGFGLVVDLHWEGSATNGATPPSFIACWNISIIIPVSNEVKGKAKLKALSVLVCVANQSHKAVCRIALLLWVW